MLTTTLGTYTRNTGSLMVTITPQGAIDDGAQWRRVGTSTWLNSGDTETDIPIGDYSVEFSDLTDWDTPADVDVTIVKDITTMANGVYTLLPLVIYTFDVDDEGWAFAGEIMPYDMPTSTILAGYLGLSARSSANCFSYWYSPDLELNDSGTYLSKWTLVSTETDPDNTVDFRLRVNQKGAWRGWNRVVNSNNQQAPSLGNAKTYDILFDPTVTGTEDNQMVMSFDIMSFDPYTANMSWIMLDSLEVYDVSVVQGSEVASYTFDVDEEGWIFQGEVPPFNIPISTVVPGRLGLCANGALNCFSYWYSPDVTIEDGKLYRVNFEMGSTSNDADLTESFRLRVNQRGSWQGWDSVINSNLQHAPSASEPKTYSVYVIPEVTGANSDDNLILSSDIMSFDYFDDHTSWIIMDNVQVEEVTILPEVLTE
jgi:hypothetical protein